MAETPRTLRLTDLWKNAKKFDEIFKKELKGKSHEEVKDIYKNKWKRYFDEQTAAGVDRPTAWRQFQNENGILLVADQTGEWGDARKFKARFTEDGTLRYTTNTSVDAQTRQWFDDFLSQATDGTPFTTADGKHLSINEIDQQFKEYHHIHGLAEGGVVAKPTIIDYINGNTAKAQAEFRTASHSWRKRGLILGSKVENMQAMSKFQHKGKDVGGHARVGRKFQDAAYLEGPVKDKNIIHAPDIIPEGAREVPGRTLVQGSGASGLKGHPDLLQRIQNAPGDALIYTDKVIVDGKGGKKYRGPFKIDEDVFTRWDAYGDLAILTDEGRKDELFEAVLPDQPTVKPGTPKAEPNLKKLKQQQAKLNLLIKNGIITKEQALQMEGVSNLVRRMDAELVTDADILRARKRLGKKVARRLFGAGEVGALGLSFTTEGRAQTIEDYEKNPSIPNWIQKQLAHGELLGDYVGTAGAALSATVWGAPVGVPMAIVGEGLSQVSGWSNTGIELLENREVVGDILTDVDTYKYLGNKVLNPLKTSRELGGVAGQILWDHGKKRFEQGKELIDQQSREETVEIPEQSTTMLNQRESAEDTEDEREMGVSNFN